LEDQPVILVVEDDQEIQIIVEDALTEGGFATGHRSIRRGKR